MPIIIIILFVVSMILSVTVRNNVLNVVQAAGYIAQGIVGRVWPVVRNTFAIVFILWIALWWYIGQKLGLPGWTFLFALAAPCLFFLIALWPLTTIKFKEKELGRFLRPTFKILAWILAPIVIIPALAILATIAIPNLSDSLGTLAKNEEKSAAIGADKMSAETEAVSGTYARIRETIAYTDEKGIPIRWLKENEGVRLLSLAETVRTTDIGDSEPMIAVVPKDSLGRYSISSSNPGGFLPLRVLDLAEEKEKAPADVKQVSLNPAAAAPAPEKVAAAAPVAQAPAPGEKSSICNYSSGTLEWEEDFSGWAPVEIKCVGNNISLRDKNANTVFNITDAEWKYNSAVHGGLRMNPTSQGNVIATGEMGTEKGWIPIRLKI